MSINIQTNNSYEHIIDNFVNEKNKSIKNISEGTQKNIQKGIKKCLKSYLAGKKYYNSDVNKSVEYFIQCIQFANYYKKKHNNSDITTLLDETKNDSYSYITFNINNLFTCKSLSIDKNDLFLCVETGNINLVKSIKCGELDLNIYNENGLTPIHYAIEYGDTKFIKHCLLLGANIEQINSDGYTLLEYACIKKDPNIISFLLEYGADMNKNLEMRKDKNYINNSNYLDFSLLQKFIITSSKNITQSNNNYFDFIDKYDIDLTNTINIKHNNGNDIIVEYLITSLNKILDNIDDNSRNTYIEIIKEELSYSVENYIYCPTNKLEIILYNLIPFIQYNQLLRVKWLFYYEIKNLILLLIKNNTNITLMSIGQHLRNNMVNSYVDTNILPYGYIDIIISNILNRFL